MPELARILWEARRDGHVVPSDAISAPASIEEAYAVQEEIAALSGFAVCGFKVGSTSLEAQRILGTAEPGSGLILAPYLLRSPASFAIAPSQMPAVEGEFALRFGRDLPVRASAYTYDEAADAVDAIAGAIEVVGSRIAGGLAGKGRSLITADGGANIALLVGAWTPYRRNIDLKSCSVAVRINGEERGRGQGAEALGDPMNVMVWLTNHQSKRGRGIKAGDIVSTGTCTGLARVSPGDHVVADFGQLGKIELVLY